ncbi:MAG: hypothetical protein AABX07_05880 [Nanoarchaeota archaeon]
MNKNMIYKPKDNREQKLKEMFDTTKRILSFNLSEKLRKKLIDILIWCISEVDGKTNLKYRSKGALDPRNKEELIHEHVFTKKQIYNNLIKSPDKTEQILKKIVACAVTKDEHDKLTKFDKSFSGWERYKQAQIEVYDISKEPPQIVDLDEKISLSRLEEGL